ncbi:unnamed protein product [Rotaria socialis]|uniref:Selenocysteine-specific elongation factor n=1 Tax=Rotaria socialis TaxID=392032 RepID=A0A820D4H7_9BILA|nr:unnamed protein product [Rotaria socialis]CAF3634119.1 unnamed protein product [Rotaria socialis]CAF4226315.1 unnamed protein product [Rotaria socialis]CAF4549531.1 unnamed protein product [Rotaria socialis]
MSILNFNVGVLGHVDSGKTSLAKALSTIASTNAFDKNPQSQERGITLDLGFSSFTIDMPEHLKSSNYSQLQITLVDCPGHASLIRTIIGGAQIIDLMLLVIDITKGIQTQTAECLIIGEITCDKMLVVLNKIDLIEEDQQQATIDKMTKRLRKTFESTKFPQTPIIPCSAVSSLNLNELVSTLQQHVYIPHRSATGPFIFSVDHCFSIRGQGTVMTGTVLSGSVRINDSIEIVSLKEVRKVKSMQMFRKPIDRAIQGDRIGLCVTQFDPDKLERGIVSTPGVIKIFHGLIIRVNKVKHFKHDIESRTKFHITCGHATVMGKIVLFIDHSTEQNNNDDQFNYGKEYEATDQYSSEDSSENKHIYALIELESPIACQLQSIMIGSRLDTDIHANTCRLAFYGHVLDGFIDTDYLNKELPSKLRVYKRKEKVGFIDRVVDDQTIIGKDLFQKETNINTFVNFKVELTPKGEQGFIESSFGQSGKFKVRFMNGLSAETKQLFNNAKGRKQQSKTATTTDADAESNEPHERMRIVLKFKKYLFQEKTVISQ